MNAATATPIPVVVIDDIAAPFNPTTDKPYAGENIGRLMGVQLAAGYASGAWAGYGQWRKAGRQVRKGERSTAIVACGSSTDAETGKRKTWARSARVFNIAQTDEIVSPAALEALRAIARFVDACGIGPGREVDDNAIILEAIGPHGEELAAAGLAGRRYDYEEGQGYLWITDKGLELARGDE